MAIFASFARYIFRTFVFKATIISLGIFNDRDDVKYMWLNLTKNVGRKYYITYTAFSLLLEPLWP